MPSGEWSRFAGPTVAVVTCIGTARRLAGFAAAATLASCWPVAAIAQAALPPPSSPPQASTGPAIEVSQNNTTLTATIDNEGSETTYELDLGADTSYGTRIFGDAGYEEGAQTVTVTLQGLAAGTTYHYRIVAKNVFGATYGADETFTTPTYPSAVLVAPVAPPLIPVPLIVSAPVPSVKAKSASVKQRAPRARKQHARSRHRTSSPQRRASHRRA